MQLQLLDDISVVREDFVPCLFVLEVKLESLGAQERQKSVPSDDEIIAFRRITLQSRPMLRFSKLFWVSLEAFELLHAQVLQLVDQRLEGNDLVDFVLVVQDKVQLENFLVAIELQRSLDCASFTSLGPTQLSQDGSFCHQWCRLLVSRNVCLNE